jgi:hypothetical protein
MSDVQTTADRNVDPNIWNYHPVVLISQGGIFRQWWNPVSVVKGILMSWFGLYVLGLALALITVLWLMVLPTMETIGGGGWYWVVQIFVVNLALMLTWAGSLHLYIYTFAKQGKFIEFELK